MKPVHLEGKRIITFVVLNVFVAICLSGISWLSLPFFYEQNNQNKVWLFLGASFLYSGLALLASRVFILPFLSKLRTKTSLIFLAIVFVFLILGIGIGNANIWAVPEIHRIELCFTADDDVQSLSIKKIMDPITNRLFPPNSFGSKKYPITVTSGICVEGRIVNLPSRMTESLMSDQVTIEIQESPPVGRFFVSINELPVVVNFTQTEKNQQSNSILLTEGFNHVQRIEKFWHSLWFYVLKAVSIVFSSLYLSLLLFGMTERIQTYQDRKSKFPMGVVNAEK